jgi:hypothetical protein
MTVIPHTFSPPSLNTFTAGPTSLEHKLSSEITTFKVEMKEDKEKTGTFIYS